MVQCLKGHAARHGAIADDGAGLPALSLARGGDRHAERDADGGAGVPDAHGVIGALAAPGEGVEAAELPDGVHKPGAARQDLVRIGLMPNVPDDVVKGSVVDIVERDGELHYAEPRGEVAARLAYGVEKEVPELPREQGELLDAELSELGRICYP